jgi:glycosyltransferase involved in cell wall biosynthesis
MIERWTFWDTLNSHGIKAPYNHYGLLKNQRNLKKVDGIHFGSGYIKGRTEKYVLLKCARKVIFNPYALKSSSSNKERNKKTISYVGELTYKKGVHKLLRALKILIDKGKNYKLLIAGVGPREKKLRDFVKKNNLKDNVTFLGWVDEPNKVYKKSVLNIVPSLWPDTLPRTAFEPIFNNCIPLVSEYGGMPEAVPLKELVLNVEEPRRLADKIEEIMETPSKQKEIKKTFKEWIKKFNIETAAKQFLSLYEEAIKFHKNK